MAGFKRFYRSALQNAAIVVDACEGQAYRGNRIDSNSVAIRNVKKPVSEAVVDESSCRGHPDECELVLQGATHRLDFQFA